MIKVYGDIMLDRWIFGSADRVSPEAPIPVLLEESQSFSVGGAGNLALNISSINGDVELYGSVGQDKEGFKLLELISQTNVNCNASSENVTTTTKTRLVGQGGQHILRWDREEQYKGISPQERLVSGLQENDIVCVSDYNKGVVRKDTIQEILQVTEKVLVDPKQTPDFYKGAYIVKPNMKEYESWFGKYTKEKAILKMREYNWKNLVVTDGANGIHVIDEENKYHHFKEEVHEVADVTGAGDTVLAVIAYGIERNMSVADSCKLACYAAARTVEKRGVVTITINDLKPTTVWTNGVFDILHEGHFKLLKFAKSKGKKLVVGINSDASTKRLKGETRPINNQLQRKMNLELLPWVDEVVIFDEDTPINVIKKFNPDLIIKGGDYTVETTVGNEVCPVEIFPIIKGHSTTNIIEKIK
jgi:D-beta-D-heptose 7-phosphate kinase/D-beta-D-heptose 1-phosphate adenosyltransferase